MHTTPVAGYMGGYIENCIEFDFELRSGVSDWIKKRLDYMLTYR